MSTEMTRYSEITDVKLGDIVEYQPLPAAWRAIAIDHVGAIGHVVAFSKDCVDVQLRHAGHIITVHCTNLLKLGVMGGRKKIDRSSQNRMSLSYISDGAQYEVVVAPIRNYYGSPCVVRRRDNRLWFFLDDGASDKGRSEVEISKQFFDAFAKEFGHPEVIIDEIARYIIKAIYVGSETVEW